MNTFFHDSHSQHNYDWSYFSWLSLQESVVRLWNLFDKLVTSTETGWDIHPVIPKVFNGSHLVRVLQKSKPWGMYVAVGRTERDRDGDNF